MRVITNASTSLYGNVGNDRSRRVFPRVLRFVGIAGHRRCISGGDFSDNRSYRRKLDHFAKVIVSPHHRLFYPLHAACLKLDKPVLHC